MLALIRSWLTPRRWQLKVMYAGAVCWLTVVHGSRYYNEPQLTVGSQATETLFAPYSSELVDPEATALAQAEIRAAAVEVLRLDPAANERMQASLAAIIAEAESLRLEPPALTSVSRLTQRYLRHLDDWSLFQAQVADDAFDPSDAPPDRAFAIREWRQLQTRPEFDAAEAAVRADRERYRQAVHQAGLRGWPPEFLHWPESQWQDAIMAAERALEQIQAVGLAPGVPSELRLQAISVHLRDRDEAKQHLVRQWLRPTLQPNLVIDQPQTTAQLEVAIAALEPTLIDVPAGSIIVAADDFISPRAFLVLDHYDLTYRQINLWALARTGAVIAAAVAVFSLSQPLLKTRLRRRDYLLITLLASSVAPTALLLGVEIASLPAVGLLLSSYYGPRLGSSVMLGTWALLPLALPLATPAALGLLAGSTLSTLIAARLRSREELALLGFGSAVTQTLVHGALSLATGGSLSFPILLQIGGASFLWHTLALGLSPAIEFFSDLITPIRLAELANPNRPLLRRLATEAPGTFQHTLFVTTLAERAAQKLNLNAELVHAGTLYHDIGKMLMAQYFIENQMGAPNPHDELDDPYQSATIIKNHVSDGLKLARQYRLPNAIRAFIPEHQGTIRIAYFYHQAQLRDPQCPDTHFRYAGPTPQTPETGVVMLADACEAALRSLWSQANDPEAPVSEVEARRVIDRIFQSRWQDGQLADSRLSRADLDTIAEVFVQVWRQCYHERIRYPVVMSMR